MIAFSQEKSFLGTSLGSGATIMKSFGNCISDDCRNIVYLSDVLLRNWRINTCHTISDEKQMNCPIDIIYTTGCYPMTLSILFLRTPVSKGNVLYRRILETNVFTGTYCLIVPLPFQKTSFILSSLGRICSRKQWKMVKK